MPVVTSRAGTVIDALVATLAAALADPIRVYDGPVAAADTMWTQAVFVGFDGDWHTTPSGDSSGGPYEAVLVNQELVYVGNTTYREELEVQCCAAMWTGETSLQAARNGVLAVFAAAQTALRVDPTLGVDGSTVATVATGTLAYDYDTAGNVGAAVRFTVHVLTTLLTT